MIDPIETIIKWLAAELTSVSGRVAAKHRYGTEWTHGATGLSVHADGGPHDEYLPLQDQRVELRIYASDTVAIKGVHSALIALSRANERFVVATTNGNAFVYEFAPEAGLSLLYEETLSMDMGVVFFRTSISEEDVP